MKDHLQPLVWSSSRGRELYQEVTKFHVPGHGRYGECPGCTLARKMERQMSISTRAVEK
jgi:hypothetical protein